jgi:acetylglutamate kinase
VTDEATLAIVRDVLANRINADICRRLGRIGGQPISFADPDGGALLGRRRLSRITAPDGRVEEVDLGFVGDLETVDVPVFQSILKAGRIPVVASLARGREGEALNVNADMVAAHVAGALGAEKAVFLTDTNGIRTNPKDPTSFVDTLSEARIAELVRDGVIDGGMLPKVEACLLALKSGVRKTHIVDGRVKHALLLEIFTDKGVGTQIIH